MNLLTLYYFVELAREHNKPVMISECGFAYWNGSQDTTNYAVDQLTKFYSYVNMLYPEVKAVFYFDIPREVETYHYGLNGNATLKSAYTAAVANNGAYLAEGQTSATGWEELSQTKLDETGTLKLACYVSFPGVKNATVQYYVDGNLAATSTQAPYYYELNTAALGAGDHSIYVVASGNQFSRTSATYTLTVPGAAEPEPEPEPEPTEQTPSDWAAALVAEAEEKGLITGRTDGLYHDQITRLQFAELAVILDRIMGYQVKGSNTFADVQDGAWYADAVLKASAAGVLQGDGANARPSATITRQEAMVMLARVMKLSGEAGAEMCVLTSKAPVTAIANYANECGARHVVMGGGERARGIAETLSQLLPGVRVLIMERE